MCKEVGAKYISSIHLNDLPRCNEKDTSNLTENQDKPGFDEEHFAFICNLTQAEYNGYLRTLVKDEIPKEFKPCFKLIERKFLTRLRPLPYFCR